MDSYVVVAECPLEEAHPRGEEIAKQWRFVRMPAMKEEERLREGQQHDGVNDGEGEHVTGDHAVDHGDERTSEANGSGEEHEKEPGGRQGKDQDGFF